MSFRVASDAVGRSRRSTAVLVGAIAAVALLVFAGFALARSFTLEIHKHATVKNMTRHSTTHEAIVTNGKGFAVYWLTGDTRSHPKCTKVNGCFSVWRPVTAASIKSLSKAPGIKGRVTAFRRDGFVQAVLRGHPLYTFTPDHRKGVATGEGVVGFGGTWHVERPASAAPAPSFY